MATFTWIPDKGAGKDVAPRLNSVQFGDGYRQDSLDGLNATLIKRQLSFSGRSAAESLAISNFLETQNGVTSFDYAHPGDISRKYKCRAWKVVDEEYVILRITAEFQQVPL